MNKDETFSLFCIFVSSFMWVKLFIEGQLVWASLFLVSQIVNTVLLFWEIWRQRFPKEG